MKKDLVRNGILVGALAVGSYGAVLVSRALDDCRITDREFTKSVKGFRGWVRVACKNQNYFAHTSISSNGWSYTGFGVDDDSSERKFHLNTASGKPLIPSLSVAYTEFDIQSDRIDVHTGVDLKWDQVSGKPELNIKHQLPRQRFVGVSDRGINIKSKRSK